MAKEDTLTLCKETNMDEFTKGMSEQERELWTETSGVYGDLSNLPEELHELMIEKTPKERFDGIEERLDFIVDIVLEIKKDLQESKGKRGEMTMNEIKEIIITEMETSKETVYPGTIAIKYKIPYLNVEKAIKELRKDKILK